MRKILTPTVALLALVSVPATAGPSYRASGFLRTGYSEQVIGPNEWRVQATGRERGKSVSVALYRAAQLVAPTGATQLRITRQQVKSQRMIDRQGTERSFHETTVLTVRAVRSTADAVVCDEQVVAQCMTLPVAGVLATYGPQLAMPAAAAGAQPAAPLPLVVSSDYQRAVADLLARRPALSAPIAAVPTPPTAAPGVGATAAPARVTPAVPLPAPARANLAVPSREQRYAELLRAARPVDGGHGWTMSD